MNDAKPLDVLIVDDDIDTCHSLKDILELDRHRVELAFSAQDARKVLQQKSNLVVLLDRKLPDGLADHLLNEFQQISHRSEYIIVTGYADLDSSISALRNGAVDYLLKPINPDALRISIQRIAERRQMEHALHEERELAERVLRTAEAVVMVLDRKGAIERASPSFYDLIGLPYSNARNQVPFLKYVSDTERTVASVAIERATKGQDTKGAHFSLQAIDRKLRALRWSFTGLHDEDRYVDRVLAIGIDLTELLEAQRVSLQSERLAAIGQTMTALAHESRNALQQIQASAEVLELEVGCNPQAQKDIQSIYRAARDLHGLLEEVRLFAAPIHLDLRRCDIAAIWLDAWKQVEHRFENKKGSLACEQPSRMPMIEVDAARMGRIFRNLFQNAFEAQDGPIEVQLTARWKEDRSELEILIADNGPGLGSIEASKIFEPFFTTKSNGTGLGLPIVKRIVDAHHGRIEVLSSIGRGTAFAITLPIDRPQMSKDYEL